MINILYERSLVDKVFVSSHSSAKQQFLKRDLKNEDDLLPALNDVHGNTIDFLQYLEENNKICVIAIDYICWFNNQERIGIYRKENSSITVESDDSCEHITRIYHNFCSASKQRRK